MKAGRQIPRQKQGKGKPILSTGDPIFEGGELKLGVVCFLHIGERPDSTVVVMTRPQHLFLALDVQIERCVLKVVRLAIDVDGAV